MNTSPGDYTLVDVGDGRRLERIGGVLVDRPAPAAVGRRKARRALWSGAELRYDRREGEGGEWTGAAPPDWSYRWRGVALGLRPAAGGQVGVFPEHAPGWERLASALSGPSGDGGDGDGTLRVLNLFAYTGAATLAALAASERVEAVHVDAARAAVAWAKENASASGLAGEGAAAPAGAGRRVSWIVEDAARFAEREARRGRRYDAVVLDPPSFGRGAKGEVWKLSRDLPPLLETVRALLDERARLVLLSAHTPGYDARVLEGMVRDMMGGLGRNGRFFAEDWSLRSEDGRAVLPAGACAGWSADRGKP